MTLLRRFFHAPGYCLPGPGVDTQWSTRWSCYLCGNVKPGRLAARRK